LRALSLTVEYIDYIKTFRWFDLKYSTKKSLAELVAVITKVSVPLSNLTGDAYS
jgi:hypothetical protein